MVVNVRSVRALHVRPHTKYGRDSCHVCVCATRSRGRVCQRCMPVRSLNKWHAEFRILPQGVKLSLSIRERQVAFLLWAGKKVHADVSVTFGCVVCAHLQENGSSVGLPKDRSRRASLGTRKVIGAEIVARQYLVSAAPPVSQASMLTMCATLTPAPMGAVGAPAPVSLNAPEMVVGAPTWHEFFVAWDGCCVAAHMPRCNTWAPRRTSGDCNGACMKHCGGPAWIP